MDTDTGLFCAFSRINQLFKLGRSGTDWCAAERLNSKSINNEARGIMARAHTKGMIGALNRGLKYSTLDDDSK